MTDEGNKTFIKITNKDIYNKLINIEDHVKRTNGKVKWNTKATYTIGCGLVLLTGWFVTFLMSSAA